MKWLIAAVGRHVVPLAALATGLVVVLDLLDVLPDPVAEWLLGALRPFVSSSSLHPPIP